MARRTKEFFEEDFASLQNLWIYKDCGNNCPLKYVHPCTLMMPYRNLSKEAEWLDYFTSDISISTNRIKS